MQRNRMRAGVERGEVQIGTWLTTVRNPDILMLLKSAGLDFVRVDMEHTALSIETVGQMAAMARALDFPIAVRPPAANREWITRLLDVGVWNIHCPQVETAAQAAEIVAASRYAPMGLRGNGGLSAATEFNPLGTVAERRAFANREVFITVMLETGGAFEHLDAIAAMPGIDALTLGRLIWPRTWASSAPRPSTGFGREARPDPRRRAQARKDLRHAVLIAGTG
ncbi:aldolase/citrate lyase family protein [Pseudoroseomonas wenyumeiae]